MQVVIKNPEGVPLAVEKRGVTQIVEVILRISYNVQINMKRLNRIKRGNARQNFMAG